MPTLSIGNLAAGGTGKTPLLLRAVEDLAALGATVGVLSRGYGGDEGQLLRARHPDVLLEEGADRVAGLARLLGQDPPEILLLDDGFQHLRLQRDFDVVLLDATRPFGRCLPAGTFRESPQALRRADLIVLARADLVDAQQRRAVWARVDEARAGMPAAPRVEGALAAKELRRVRDGAVLPLADLRGMRVRLAAGIGNPRSFAALCRGLGVEPVAEQWLPDHHAWRAADVAGWAEERAVLVTEKDAVKLRGLAPENAYELRVDWRFLDGGEHWQGLLERLHLPVRAARIEPLWQAHDPHGRGVGR